MRATMKSTESANYFDDNSERILDAFRIVKQFWIGNK